MAANTNEMAMTELIKGLWKLYIEEETDEPNSPSQVLAETIVNSPSLVPKESIVNSPSHVPTASKVNSETRIIGESDVKSAKFNIISESGKPEKSTSVFVESSDEPSEKQNLLVESHSV